MSVSYANTLKDTRMSAVLTAIDGQTNPAWLEICTVAYASILVVITFSKPSFSEGTQKLTMLNAPKSGVAANSGDAVIARIKDGAGTIWVSNLTVGTSNADIILNSISITSGQTVTITSGSITHSP